MSEELSLRIEDNKKSSAGDRLPQIKRDVKSYHMQW